MMSLTLLLEKYDVSTEEGLQKALNEIEKEESEVNESLSNALSRACTLEGRLRAASQTYSKLGVVKNDSEVATDMVDKTAVLARDVSAKVRQLDLARSRVAECQRRVHDLIDLRVCSAGVDTAIKAQDYETAAAHVSRFLCMEPGSVAAARARGPDPRRDMDAAAATLRERLLRKFQEAAKREDDAAVERLFELFPRIGRAEEGVDLLAGYLASQLEASLRRAGDASSRGGAVFADALTRALEAGAAAVERARRLLPPAPPGLLPRALRLLQPTVCSCVRRLSASLARAPSLAERPDPLLVEPALAELALAHSRMQLYFNFLRRRVEVRPTRRPLPAGRNVRSDRNHSVAAVERERRRSARGGGRGGRREDHRRLRHDAQRPGPAGPVPDAGEILPGGEHRQGAEAVDAGARRDRVQPGGRRLLHREEGHQARHLHGQRGRGVRRAERGGRAAGAGGAGAAAAAGLPAARRAAAGRAPGAAAAARARGRAVPGARRRGGGRRAVGGAPGAGGGGGGRAAVPGQPAGAGQAALVRGGAGGRGRRLPRRPGAGGGGAAGVAAAGRHGVGRRARGARRRRRGVRRGGGRAAGRPGRAGGGGAGAAAAGGRRAAGRRAGRPAGAGAAHAAAAALRAARRAGGRAALPAPGGLGGRRRAGAARAGGRAGGGRRAAGAGAPGARGGGAGPRARAVAGGRQGGAAAPPGLRPRRRAAPASVSEPRPCLRLICCAPDVG